MYASRTFDEAPSYILTDDLFGEPGYSSADTVYSKNNREQFIGNNQQISGIQPQFNVAPSAKNLDFATNKDMNKLYNAVNKMYINVCDKVSNIMNNNSNNVDNGDNNDNILDDKKMCKQLNKLNKRLTTIIYLLLFIILVVIIVMIIRSVKYIKFNNPIGTFPIE